MKNLYLYLVLLCPPIFAQSNYTEIKGPAPFYFLYPDSNSYSQITVAEYDKFMAVFELPFSDNGAGKARQLSQNTDAAEKFLSYIQNRFHKPVKYIFSTHWHQHSLSALTPFLNQGAELYSSQSSWNYLVKEGFINVDSAKKFFAQIHLVKKDTTVLKGTKLPVQIVFLDSTYENKPTRDYLFFNFPTNKMMMGSCMCAVSNTSFSTAPVYSDRLDDLRRAIEVRSLQVTSVIGLGKKSKSDPDPVHSYSAITNYMNAGKPASSITKRFSCLTAKYISLHTDSLLKSAISTTLSAYLLNSAVYDCIRKGKYEAGVELARLLNLYSPGLDSYIDTMGEASLANGDLAAAERYDKLLKQRFPKFTNGGLDVWKENQQRLWK